MAESAMIHNFYYSNRVNSNEEQELNQILSRLGTMIQFSRLHPKSLQVIEMSEWLFG